MDVGADCEARAVQLRPALEEPANVDARLFEFVCKHGVPIAQWDGQIKRREGFPQALQNLIL